MTRELILLFIINTLSAIGYSLIAPLFPSIAHERGLKEHVIGIIISIFAISNFVATPSCPKYIGLYGRKQMFYVAMSLEASCTFIYAFMELVDNYYIFLLISFVSRFMHGIGSALSATLVYSSAASICDIDNLKVTLGYMEFAWCLGTAIGPLFAAILYYLGDYSTPFYVFGLLMALTIPFIYNLNIPEKISESQEEPQFIKCLLDMEILTIFFAVVMDMISKSFFYPTFTTYLIEKYNMSIEGSSIFFVLNMFSYLIMLQFLTFITQKLGLKLTIVVGLFFNFIGILFMPPISILPQYPFVIVIGLFILGIPGAFINVPAICDMIETLKSRHNYDEENSNNMSSAIYNLGLNLGEAVGPTLGGYITNKRDFSSSCVFTSLLNLLYCIIFLVYNLQVIKSYTDNQNERLIEKENDFYVPSKIGSRSPSITKEYLGRYRSYSHSSSISKGFLTKN